MKVKEKAKLRMYKRRAFLSLVFVFFFATCLSSDVNADNAQIEVLNTIPSIDQGITGYPLGCEGVSLYMALRGKGYLFGVTLDRFMTTMPRGETPKTGYMGNPMRGRQYNGSKRTTIYPKPCSGWIKRFCNGKCYDMTGASPYRLRAELAAGNIVGVYITGGYQEPSWNRYPWGRDIMNNHFICVVGYTNTGDYIINDCAAGIHGLYVVKKDSFELSYGYRKWAVVLR